MENLSVLRLENNYGLSIRFGSDGFSFCVYDESNMLISTKTVSFLLFSLSENEIVDLLRKEIEHKLVYSSIRLVCELDIYAFVPAAIFKSEERTTFLSFQHKLDKSHLTLYNALPAWDMALVFSIPNVLKNALNNLFPNVPIEHHLCALLTDKIKSGTETCVYIEVRTKKMDAVVFKNGAILLINSFPYASCEDFVYFTLNLFDQLSLDTESCKVKLYHSEKKPELKSLIQKYVKSVISD